MDVDRIAPELDVSEWLGEPHPLAGLRGRVVLIEAFQMLCPGCVSHGLPQVERVRKAFPEVVTLGLHTVFEHHEAMTPVALRAFASEYGIAFPVGVDRHDGDATPVTMRRYGLRGTPSTVLIDQQGRVRLSVFGVVDDLVLGARIGTLLATTPAADADDPARDARPDPGLTCAPDGACS